MARFGSDAFIDSAGTGGGVHSGIAAAMVAVVGRTESVDVAERNRILEDLEGRQMHPTERSSINNDSQSVGGSGYKSGVRCVQMTEEYSCPLTPRAFI